jgi:hypothetical protein
MSKITIRRADMTIEAELSFDQLKELLGVNGHRPSAEQPQLFEVVKEPRRKRRAATKPHIQQGDMTAYLRNVSARAKKFLNTVRDHPQGIEVEELVSVLGFNTANQIGGLTGPGVVKIAKEYGFEAEDLYTSVITFTDGKRKRMFYPGKLLLRDEVEKTRVV